MRSACNADDSTRKMDSTTPPLHTGALHAHGNRSSNLIEKSAALNRAIPSSPSCHESSADRNSRSLAGASSTFLDKGDGTATSACHTLTATGLPAHDKKIHYDHGTTMMTLDDVSHVSDAMDNDTIDTVTSQRQPLHTSVSWSNEMLSVEFASTPNHILDTDTIASNKTLRRSSPFGLTLSAFRRPEHTVRIADMDTSRKITTEYDFDAPECRVLGHGASSTVRLAVRRSDGVPVAVKSVAKHEALRFRRMRHGSRRHLDEWELLRSLRDNPHVVSLLDVFETDEEIQLVLEYCEGGELFDEIQTKRKESLASPDKVYSYSESKAAKIILQMLSVLSELHSRGIVHRDVKPENILLRSADSSDICAKLSDFGTSRELHPEEESDSCSSDGEASPLTPQSRKRTYSSVGSNFYAAPEIHAGRGYDTAVDMYSLGVTLYVLLCGFPPSFTAKEDVDIVTFPSCHWSNISQDAKNLIRKMLDSDASNRITASQALQDPWIARQTKSPVRAARSTLSPSAPRPVVDMELVRSRLFKGLDSDSEEEIDTMGEQRLQKRRKLQDEPNLIVAMASLCEDLESAAASVTAAAAGVMMDENDCICVVEDIDDERVPKDSPRVTSPFEASFTALSV